MHLQSDVCIVGNGVIGKATALGLAQAGFRVCLLSPSAMKQDAAADMATWDVRVYAINHVARALLTSLKVWDAMDVSRIEAVDAMEVNGDAANDVSASGHGSLTFDAYGARVSALTWIVEDRNVNQALDAALKFAPNVSMVSGRASEMVIDQADVCVRLDNGGVLRASLLIGADGAQSWVRGQCDIGIDYRAYGQRAIVTNFACELPHHGVAAQWFIGAEGIVALLPLPGRRVSLVWSAPEALAEKVLSESLAQLAQRVTAVSGGKYGQLTPLQPDVIKAIPLALIRPHAIIAPRVALVGDAAHAVHPLAGQGMNLGFADVNALLKAIAERGPHRDCGDARVLGRYARARKEDILLMQLTTDGLERLFRSDFEPFRVMRNLGLNLINVLPVIKKRLISHALGK